MNPAGRSSSRADYSLQGWEHNCWCMETHSHRQTHRATLFYERDGKRQRERERVYFFTWEGKSCSVELTKIGKAGGNLQKELMGAVSDGGFLAVRSRDLEIQMNMRIRKRMDYILIYINTVSILCRMMPVFGSHAVLQIKSCLTYSTFFILNFAPSSGTLPFERSLKN